jgi:hypothetical protein
MQCGKHVFGDMIRIIPVRQNIYKMATSSALLILRIIIDPTSDFAEMQTEFLFSFRPVRIRKKFDQVVV